MEIDSNNPKTSGSDGKWKRIISVGTRVIVSGIVLYFVISLVHWQNVLRAYQSADGRYILVGLLLLTANLGVRIMKWRSMLYSVKSKPTFWEALGSVMLGISLGSFTPVEIGEYAGRALHISDAKRSHLVGLALLDKAQISIITYLMGIVSLAFFMFDNLLLIIFISFAVIIVSAIFLLHMELLTVIGHRLNASFFKKPWLTGILDGFTLLKPRQILSTIFYTIIFHGVLVLQMFFLISAFNEITLVHAFIGTSAMMFVKSLLPISLSDIGIREAGSIFFFSPYGISQVAALDASLLLFVINIFIPSVIGIYFLKHHQFTPSKLLQFIKKQKNATLK